MGTKEELFRSLVQAGMEFAHQTRRLPSIGRFSALSVVAY
jgi:hypothetical protein